MTEVEQFKYLSAIWVMSCRDETSLQTYRGVKERLQLPAEFDLPSFVRCYPELFRLGAVPSYLECWKKRLRAGKSRPAWLKKLDSDAQTKAIDALAPDDVFRCQFRRSIKEGKCDMDIMKWGLNHIDRLRRAHADASEARLRKWQVLGAIILGLIGIFTTVVLQIINLAHR